MPWAVGLSLLVVGGTEFCLALSRGMLVADVGC